MKKRIIPLFMLILVLFAMCTLSPGSALDRYDDNIYRMAKQSYESLSEDDFGHTISVKEFENSSFQITLDGITYFTRDADDQIIITKDSFIISNISPVADLELNSMFERAKTNVVDYVSYSTIITSSDKEEIGKNIFGIPLYSASFTLDEGIKSSLTDEELKSIGEIVAIYEDGSVYINSSCSAKVTEFILTHELFHFVSEITNKGFENQDYSYNVITEVITDFLAVTAAPPQVEIVDTSYRSYYDDALLYISVFNKDALRAYFYGYDHIWEKAGKDSVDFFVYCLDNLENDFCKNAAKLMVIQIKKDL